MRTVVGVISDTHGLLRPDALRALRGSDLIVHAGDIGSPDILLQLAELSPVIAIRGNIDWDDWAYDLPPVAVVDIGGLTFYVLHNLKTLDLKPEIAGFAAVISGHSHVPAQKTRHGVLYFNPGSAGPRRFTLPVAVGRLLISDSEIRAEHIMLDV